MEDGRGQELMFKEEEEDIIATGREERARKQKFKPYDQEQTYLFPARLDDYVGPYHIARLVSAFIDNIDLSALLEGYKGGASAYNPAMLLKVWILGYMYRIYTSRPLSRTVSENAAFMWISGNQRPDFHTLCNFRNRLKEDIKTIFKEIVKTLLRKGLIKGEEIFIDHTKMEADANRHKMVWQKNVDREMNKIENELEILIKKIERIQAEEDSKDSIIESDSSKIREALEGGMMRELVKEVNDRLKERKISREEAKENKKGIRRAFELKKRKEDYEEKRETLGKRSNYSKTDTDATAMMMKDGVIKGGYNEGIAVENGFVLGYVESQNAGDNVSFKELVEDVKENTEKKPESITADGAYGSEENLEYMEDEEITSYVKYNTFHKEQTKKYYEEKFRLEAFKYDQSNDSYQCPAGAILYFQQEKENITATGFKQHVRIYSTLEGCCESCPLKAKCTESSRRTLTINKNYNRLKRKTKENLLSKKGIEMRKQRGHNVETVFGDRKGNHKFRRFHLRGKDKVSVESGLYYCTYNMKRLYNTLMNGGYREKIIPLLHSV